MADSSNYFLAIARAQIFRSLARLLEKNSDSHPDGSRAGSSSSSFTGGDLEMDG